MTFALTAAGSSPISYPDHDSDYRAGFCNIGPAEIRRRRNTGHAALIFTVALFGILVIAGVPPIVRFVVALPAAVAIACYLEAYLKFCIGFGWLGVFNFGARGNTQHVADGAARTADRRRSMRLTAGLAVACVAIGVVAVVLPV